MKATVFYIALALWTIPTQAQLLNSEKQHRVTVGEGVSIILIPSVDEPSRYYYLPNSIQLSTQSGVPEASLLFYRDKSNAFGGGILHVLMTWGLTAEQEKTAIARLHKIDSTATLAGAAELEFPNNGIVEFTRTNEMSAILQRSANAAIRIAPTPYSKSAASFHLSSEDAEKIWKLVESNSPQGASARLGIDYSYKVAEYAGAIRISVNRHARMETSVATWIQALTQFNLIKYTSI